MCFHLNFIVILPGFTISTHMLTPIKLVLIDHTNAITILIEF